MTPDTPHFSRHGSYDTFASYRAHTPDPILALAAPTTRTERMAAYSQYIPDARRLRSFFLRLPLATRGFLLVIIVLYFVHFFYPLLTIWGALIPDLINLGTCMTCSPPRPPPPPPVPLCCMLTCLSHSIQTKHLSTHTQIRLPSPPQPLHADTTARALRIRARHHHHFHPLHRTLWPHSRSSVHVPRAICVSLEHRSGWEFDMGLSPPRE